MDEEQMEFKYVFKRNPKAPVHYAPLVDVRKSDRDLHLLLYVPPAPHPAEIIKGEDGQAQMVVKSSAEVVLPLEAVEPLLRNLAKQYRDMLIEYMRRDAKEAGIAVSQDVHMKWLDSIVEGE